jgi:hypothetical protein
MVLLDKILGLHKKRMEREALEAETDRILAEIQAHRAQARVEAGRDLNATQENLEAISASLRGGVSTFHTTE